MRAPLTDPTTLWPSAVSSMAMSGLAMTGAIRQVWLSMGLASVVGVHWTLTVGVPLNESIQLAALFGPVVVAV
ncbi:hypothetical protein HJ590_10545 [Naumannella sp. ID2617S]|nr:hypothetical protein [Naumannella sp. ID2617S]